MEPKQYYAVAIIGLAIYAIVRGIDVRIVLFLAAAILAALANDATLVLRSFLNTFCSEKFVVPICTAMGFAYVLRHTGCDRHLVRLLTRPLRSVRGLLVPGVVVVGFIVNIPVISQTSTAVCVGPVVIPLMRAAGFAPATIAACLCLGASVGGELLNPGAPELVSVSALTKTDPRELTHRVMPRPLFAYLAVATLAFWAQTLWRDRRATLTPVDADATPDEPLNLFRAFVPMVPLAILFVTGPPFSLIEIPGPWIGGEAAQFGTRLIGVAMLYGVFVAAAANRAKASGCAKQFFEGAGYGFTTVVSLIVTATCFADAVKAVGLAQVLGRIIAAEPDVLTPLAGVVPCGFAAICGSGMASTQGLFGFFHKPALDLGQDPDAVGALVSIASAAGRTMSPVAAVVLMCASLTGVTPVAVIARVAGPLLLALATVIGLRMCGVL